MMISSVQYMTPDWVGLSNSRRLSISQGWYYVPYKWYYTQSSCANAPKIYNRTIIYDCLYLLQMSRSGSNSRFSMSWPLTNNLRDVFRVPAPIETSRRFQKKNPCFPGNRLEWLLIDRGQAQAWSEQYIKQLRPTWPMAGQKLGIFGRPSYGSTTWEKPGLEVTSLNHQKLHKNFKAPDETPIDFSTEWKCRVIHLQPGAGWPKKTIFHRPIMISKSRKNIVSLWTNLKMVWRYSQKKHHINHKHLGSSWYILGLSWFLILSPVWIVLWCFFVEKCWKHLKTWNRANKVWIALTAPIWAVPFWPGRFIELALFFWNIGSTVWDIFIHPFFRAVVRDGALETEWLMTLMTLSWILQFPHLDILLLSNFSLRNAAIIFFCLRKKFAHFCSTFYF